MNKKIKAIALSSSLLWFVSVIFETIIILCNTSMSGQKRQWIMYYGEPLNRKLCPLEMYSAFSCGFLLIAAIIPFLWIY